MDEVINQVTIQRHRNPGEFPDWQCFARLRPRPQAREAREVADASEAGRTPAEHEQKGDARAPPFFIFSLP